MQWSYSGDVVITTDASRALQLLDIRYGFEFGDEHCMLNRRGLLRYTATRRGTLPTLGRRPPDRLQQSPA